MGILYLMREAAFLGTGAGLEGYLTGQRRLPEIGWAIVRAYGMQIPGKFGKCREFDRTRRREAVGLGTGSGMPN